MSVAFGSNHRAGQVFIGPWSILGGYGTIGGRGPWGVGPAGTQFTAGEGPWIRYAGRTVRAGQTTGLTGLEGLVQQTTGLTPQQAIGLGQQAGALPPAQPIAPAYYPPPVYSTGPSMTTVLLLVGGAGLVAWLILK